MVNKQEFKATIIKKGYTNVELSQKIGMNPATFYRKLNSNAFTLNDLEKIRKALDLSLEEVELIFFTL